MDVVAREPASSTGETSATVGMSGRKALVGIVGIVGAFFLLSLVSGLHNRSLMLRDQRDDARLAVAGNVIRAWTPTADGKVLRLVASRPDARVTDSIRRTLKRNRWSYLHGDYAANPAALDGQAIAGRAELEWGSTNGLLNVRYREVADGAELRWITSDSVMRQSLDEWVTSTPPAKKDAS